MVLALWVGGMGGERFGRQEAGLLDGFARASLFVSGCMGSVWWSVQSANPRQKSVVPNVLDGLTRWVRSVYYFMSLAKLGQGMFSKKRGVVGCSVLVTR